MKQHVVVVVGLVLAGGCVKKAETEKAAETAETEKEKAAAEPGSGTGSQSAARGTGSQSAARGTGSGSGSACTKVIGKVTGSVRAMDTRPFEDATKLWAAEPASCRDADWYRAAVVLMRFWAPKPLVAGDGVSLAGPKEAFEGGLAVAPDDLELLTYLSFVAAVDPDDAPAPPADACARVTALPAITGSAAELREHDARLDYVCARWDEIDDPPYPDVGLRRALALAAAGKAKEARAIAKEARAMIDRGEQRPGVTDGDAEAMRTTLAQSLK